jgi:hypothetical protein
MDCIKVGQEERKGFNCILICRIAGEVLECCIPSRSRAIKRWTGPAASCCLPHPFPLYFMMFEILFNSRTIVGDSLEYLSYLFVGSLNSSITFRPETFPCIFPPYLQLIQPNFELQFPRFEHEGILADSLPPLYRSFDMTMSCGTRRPKASRRPLICAMALFAEYAVRTEVAKIARALGIEDFMAAGADHTPLVHFVVFYSTRSPVVSVAFDSYAAGI